VIACSPEILIEHRTNENGSGENDVAKRKTEAEPLRGWRKIARFLGWSFSVTECWAKFEMPIIHEGRRVHASPEELTCAKMTILEGGFERRLGFAR